VNSKSWRCGHSGQRLLGPAHGEGRLRDISKFSPFIYLISLCLIPLGTYFMGMHLMRVYLDPLVHTHFRPRPVDPTDSNVSTRNSTAGRIFHNICQCAMGNVSTRNSTARLHVVFPYGLLNSELTNMAMSLAVIPSCKKVH